MMKKDYLRYWFLVNIIIVVASIMMGWFAYGFEPPPALIIVSGWQFLTIEIVEKIMAIIDNGYTSIRIFSILEGFCGILFIGYLILKTANIIKLRTYSESKILTSILFIITFFFLSRSLFYGYFQHLMLGYWLFVFGLISSSLYELWALYMNYK